MKKFTGYLAFDFDCVISTYKRPFKFNDLGKPNDEVIETMRHFSKLGYYILIFTGRVFTPKMKTWLKKYQVPYDGFNIHPNNSEFESKFKPYFEVIIDDKAVNVHFKNNKKSKTKLIKDINTILSWRKK